MEFKAALSCPHCFEHKICRKTDHRVTFPINPLPNPYYGIDLFIIPCNVMR